MGAPVVVVSHQVPTEWVADHPHAALTFVTDGVKAAIAAAQEIAGDQVVAVAAVTIARPCLELGLLDEVAVDLVPGRRAQSAPGGASSTVGRYSSSCERPSKVRLSTRSSATSG